MILTSDISVPSSGLSLNQLNSANVNKQNTNMIEKCKVKSKLNQNKQTL